MYKGGGESAAHVRTTQESGREAQCTEMGGRGSGPGAPRKERQLQGQMERQVSLPDQDQTLLSQKEGNCKSGARCGEPGEQQDRQRAHHRHPAFRVVF